MIATKILIYQVLTKQCLKKYLPYLVTLSQMAPAPLIKSSINLEQVLLCNYTKLAIFVFQFLGYFTCVTELPFLTFVYP